MPVTQSEIIEQIKKYHDKNMISCEIKDKGDDGIEFVAQGRFMKNLHIKEKNIYVHSLNPRYYSKKDDYEKKDYKNNNDKLTVILEYLLEIICQSQIDVKKIIFTGRSTNPELKAYLFYHLGFRTEDDSHGNLVLELDENKNVLILLLKHFKMITAIKELLKKNQSFYGSWERHYSDFDNFLLQTEREKIKEKKKRYRTDSLHFCYYYYYKGLIGSMTMTYDNDGLFLIENEFLYQKRISKSLDINTIENELLDFLENVKKSGRMISLLSPSDFNFKLKIYEKCNHEFLDFIEQPMFHYFLKKFGNIDKLEKEMANSSFPENSISTIWNEYFPYNKMPRYPEKIYDLRYFLGTYVLMEEVFAPRAEKNIHFFEELNDLIKYINIRDISATC